MSPSIAEVILDDALEKSLDYAIPAEWNELTVGMRVEVPLRGRSAKGTVMALKEKSAFKNIKPLIRIASSQPVVSIELFKLALWISKYYCCPIGRVLKTILPPTIRDENKTHKMQLYVKPLLSQEKLKELCLSLRGKSSSQAKVIDLLLEKPKGLFLSEILERAAVSQSPVNTLAKKGVLQAQEVQVDRSPVFAHEFFPTKPKCLGKEQQIAYDAIVKTLGTFQPHLIHGITGSGKTEVYLQAIQETLNRGESIIYLVPEISLTSQTIERFKGRFGGEQIAILHHRLSDGERFDAWHRIRDGSAKIIIGARSAIFSPASRLGLIIVDEEHEATYKQSDESPKYHARDIAVVRAKLSSCPVILGSATPSLESYHNAQTGKYQLHTLLSRADRATMANVHIIDMKREFVKAKGYTLFSEPLIDGIRKRFEKGEQTLLFLNRRGYHTSAMCPSCSHVETCPHCDLSLTFHKGEAVLACHLCDFRKSSPRQCPGCGKDDSLKYKGVGTEMVEKSLHALLPDIRTLRLDADTTKHKGSHERLFKQFRSGKADVLIGTQMIAKGLHFPSISLVGVIGLDGSLSIPDFRASETVFQLLTQVAGRSGRGDIQGEVILQTHLPDHPIILHAANQDYPSFYAEEIEVRKIFSFPPFSHLVKCSFSGSDAHKCEKGAGAFRQTLIQTLPKGVEIHPVVPCGYAKIKNNYRFQCLIKTERLQTILGPLQMLRTQFGVGKGVRLSIDVDPLTTYF